MKHVYEHASLSREFGFSETEWWNGIVNWNRIMNYIGLPILITTTSKQRPPSIKNHIIYDMILWLVCQTTSKIRPPLDMLFNLDFLPIYAD